MAYSEPVELTSEAGLRMLDNLPPYYADDPAVLSYLQTVGQELDRAEEAMESVRDGFYPQKATDTYRLLGMWESLLGLPYETPDQSLALRRATVLSKLQSRQSASAEQWANAVTTAVGSTAWEQRELYPGSYQLTVTIPYNPSGVAATNIARILRDITPAHIQLIVGYDGYVVDVSTVDLEPI